MKRHVLTPPAGILVNMPKHTGFFTKALAQTLAVIERMAAPEGTTIEDLTRRLSLTRRSVFRLIRTIEHDFNVPVIVERKVFGGPAAYRLPSSFIEKFSHFTAPPLTLTFNQALLFYLLLNDELFSGKPEEKLSALVCSWKP
jgi:hypothetical protein